MFGVVKDVYFTKKIVFVMLNSGISGWGSQGDVTSGGTFLGLKSGLKQMKKINTLLKHYINFLQKKS